MYKLNLSYSLVNILVFERAIVQTPECATESIIFVLQNFDNLSGQIRILLGVTDKYVILLRPRILFSEKEMAEEFAIVKPDLDAFGTVDGGQGRSEDESNHSYFINFIDILRTAFTPNKYAIAICV